MIFRKHPFISNSAWMVIQALVLSQLHPVSVWADSQPFSEAHALRGSQRETQSGLEEIRDALVGRQQQEPAAGMEEFQTVGAAMGALFAPGSGRQEEIRLENFLAERWADQIRAAAGALQSATGPAQKSAAEQTLRQAVERHERQIAEFIRLIEEDRRRVGLLAAGESVGPYTLPRLEARDVPAPGQRSGSGDLAIDIPSDRAIYELERLHLMARTAIQRALGREVVVNVGIGFVGAAVSTATAAESRRDFGTISVSKKRKLKYRPPLEGRAPAYFTIAYQRPSPASAYKVPAVNRGVSPIATKDPSVGQKIRQTVEQGTLTATYLAGSIAAADTVMLETELHAAKVLPTHLEHSRIEDEATLRLIRQVGQLMRRDALVIVESTIAPGFLRGRLLPAINEELQGRGLLRPGEDAHLAHAFQRLEPGPRWYRSLLEQERVGAGVTQRANELLERYFQTVGFQYRIFSRVEAVEFMKTLENAWRFGLLELMSAYLRAGELVGVDTFEIARLIARARPATHGLITAIPSIQVGGYCVPKELILIVASLGDQYGVQAGEIMEIFNTRFGAAVASDFRGRVAPARAAEALAEEGRRLDDARVHVLGITYGPGVADTRMSGVERAVRELAQLGVDAARITVTDPYAQSWPELQQQQLASPESWGHGLANQQRLSEIQVDHSADPYRTIGPDLDVLLLGTRHPQYIGKNRLAQERTGPGVPGLDPVKVAARVMGRRGRVLVDTFDFLSDEDYKLFLALGWKIRALGKGHLADLERALTLEERIAANEALIRELRALRGQQGVEADELASGIASVEAHLRQLRAERAVAQAAREETKQRRRREADSARTRAAQARAEQEALHARRELEEARQWLDDADPRVQRRRRAVQIHEAEARQANRRLERPRRERAQDLLWYSEETVVRPAMRRAAGMVKKTSFMHGVPARYLMTQRPLSLADESRVDASMRGPVRRAEFLLLAGYLDQAFHMMDYLLLEVFTPQEIQQMLTEIRHEEEKAHPERKLRPETRAIPYWVYDNQGNVVQKTQVRVPLVRPFRWRTNLETGELEVLTDPRNWMNTTLKQLPDMLRRELPEQWGRYFVVVRPKLVPAEGAEIRAYPPGFDDLPPELGMWLARDVIGKGTMLTTLGGEGAVVQDKVLFVMVVDPHGAGSGRAGYLVWADSLHPVVSVTPEGYEVPVSLKGVGLFVGGDERFPHTQIESLGTTTGRRVSGGMTVTGTVGQSTLAQAPGFVTGVGSEHGLTELSATDAYHRGQAPRLVFGVNFTFAQGARNAQGQQTEYFVSARQEFDTARMGWRFRGERFDHAAEASRAAHVLGWNAAELLGHLPSPAIHIALSLDNVQANGYLTDPDSIVPPLYRERNPYGALYKYFGFAMQQTVMGWQQMRASKEGSPFDIEDEHLKLMRPWLRGFMGHLLESGRVRRAPLERFNRLSKLSDDEFLVALRRGYDGASNRELFNAMALGLIDTLWNRYLAYELFRHRVRRGYSHTVESTYTGTAGERFNPASAEEAQRYLRSQREILEISRRLIEEGQYPPVDFNFRAAIAEISQREARLTQLVQQDAHDFRELYPVTFYPPEVAPIVSVLDLSAVAEGARPIHVAGEIPRSAPIVEKEVVTIPPQPRPGSTPASGMEEAGAATEAGLASTFTLAEWQRIAADPDGTGLKRLIEGWVPEGWVQRELEKAQKLILDAGKRRIFDRNLPVALVRSPGRARIFMGHPDLPGIGGFSIDVATSQSVWMLVQLTEDGRVIADNLDPQYGRLEFGINDEDVLPTNAERIRAPRPQWYDWAMRHQFSNRWEGLVKGTLAFIRTGYLDPDGIRHRTLKGMRLLLSESDLPSGKGFSASSALPAGIGLALNGLWAGQAAGLRLSMKDLTQLDYAAYVTGDLAGVADITAILMGEKDYATVLWYDPDRVGERVKLPNGFRVFAVDSNVRRLDEPEQPDDLKNYAKYVRKLSNVAVRLAVLWMRAMARENPKELGLLEEVLTANDTTGVGVVRELTEAGVITKRKYAQMVAGAGPKPAIGRGAAQKREVFLQQVMAQIPNDWTLGQIVRHLKERLPDLRRQIDDIAKEVEPLGAHKVSPRARNAGLRLKGMRMTTRIPMRQFAWYGIRETERGLEWLQAAKDDNPASLPLLMEAAHSGDRALYDPTEPFLAGTLRLSRWAWTQPVEAYQRSLLQIDRQIDQFNSEMDRALRNRGKARGRISGAGLGGFILVGVASGHPKQYEIAKGWWNRGARRHQVVEIEPSAGARLVRLPPLAAGMEEGLERATRSVPMGTFREKAAFFEPETNWPDHAPGKEIQPANIPAYAQLVLRLLNHPVQGREILGNAGIDPAEVESLAISTHQDRDKRWHLFPVILRLRGGQERWIGVRLYDASYDHSDPRSHLREHEQTARRLQELAPGAAVQFFAGDVTAGSELGEDQPVVWEALEYVPYDLPKPDGVAWATQAIRFWEASSAEPRKRFLPPLYVGKVHFFRGPQGEPTARILELGQHAPLPAPADVLRHLLSHSTLGHLDEETVVTPAQIVEGVLNALGPDRGREFLRTGVPPLENPGLTEAWVRVRSGMKELTPQKLDEMSVRGAPLRQLLQQVPPALDPWLDRPTRVAIWVADLDHTLSIPDEGPLSGVMRSLIADSILETGARWWVNTGSGIGDAGGTDVVSRFLDPVEREFQGRGHPEGLVRIGFQAAVGQQTVSYDTEGNRRMRGVPGGPVFTPSQQVETLRLWLSIFVDQYPQGRDREAWRVRVLSAQDAAQLEALASELEKAWGVKRLRIARRGVDPETGVLNPDRPGMITLMLPHDGSLAELAAQMAQAFDRELRPSMPRELKPTIPGKAFVTVLFYAKEDQILRDYQAVAAELTRGDGIVVSLGDNPGSDTFFNLSSGQFGRPVLHFLVDRRFSADRPDLLRTREQFSDGSRQVIEMFLQAQRQGVPYRALPLFEGQFSIADVERETGYAWPDLRLAAGMEEVSKTADLVDEQSLTRRFEESARELGLTFVPGETPVFLWVGSHLGGGTVPMFNEVFQEWGAASFGGKVPVMLPMEIPEGDFNRVFPLILRHPQLQGIDVTAPYKTAVAEKAEAFGIVLDETAQQVQVVSFLKKQPSSAGDWIGSIPDGEGWVESYEPLLPDETFRGKRIAQFGAGGAGRAVLVALAREDRRPSSVTVVEPDSAQRVAVEKLLRDLMPGVEIRAAESEDSVRGLIQRANVHMNASPLGKLDSQSPLKDPSLIQPGSYVFDLNWWRTAPPDQFGDLTPYLAQARDQGAFIYNGMRMSTTLDAHFAARWLGQGDDERFQGVLYQKMYERAVAEGFLEPEPSAGMEEANVAKIKQYLTRHSYPGGPIRMLVDELKKPEKRVVVWDDPHPMVMLAPSYGEFLGLLMAELHEKANVRWLLIEDRPEHVEERLPYLQRWVNSKDRDRHFDEYLESLHLDHQAYLRVKLQHPQWSGLMRAAVERSIPVVGFDPRAGIYDEEPDPEALDLPSVGGKTEALFAELIQGTLSEMKPGEKALVIAGGDHVAETKPLKRMGSLLRRSLKGQLTTVLVEAGWDLAEPRPKEEWRLKQLLGQLKLPVVALARTGVSPLRDVQFLPGAILEGGRVTADLLESLGKAVPVLVRDFNQLVYFGSPQAIDQYLKEYRKGAGMEEGPIPGAKKVLGEAISVAEQPGVAEVLGETVLNQLRAILTLLDQEVPDTEEARLSLDEVDNTLNQIIQQQHLPPRGEGWQEDLQEQAEWATAWEGTQEVLDQEGEEQDAARLETVSALEQIRSRVQAAHETLSEGLPPAYRLFSRVASETFRNLNVPLIGMATDQMLDGDWVSLFLVAGNRPQDATGIVFQHIPGAPSMRLILVEAGQLGGSPADVSFDQRVSAEDASAVGQVIQQFSDRMRSRPLATEWDYEAIGARKILDTLIPQLAGMEEARVLKETPEEIIVEVPFQAGSTLGRDLIEFTVNYITKRLHPVLSRFEPLASSASRLEMERVTESTSEDEREKWYEWDLKLRGAPRMDRDASIALSHVLLNAVDAVVARAREEGKAADGPYWLPGKVTARVARDGQGWVVEVSDNGSGFTPETLRELFLVKTSTKAEDVPMRWGGGMGIGFTEGMYGDRVVARFGGRIEIETRNRQTGSHRLRFDPASGASEVTEATRQEEGTTVRWILPDPAGLEETVEVLRTGNPVQLMTRDVVKLAKLQAEFDGHAYHLERWHREEQFKQLAESGDKGMGSFVVVARDPKKGGEIVGFVLVTTDPRGLGPSILELEQITVETGYEGRGIGTRMVEQVFDHILQTQTPSLSKVTQLLFYDQSYLRENHVVLKVARARGYSYRQDDQHNRAYWMQLPRPTAGLEERKVILLSPDAAVEPLFDALVRVRPGSQGWLKVVAFARGEEQRSEINTGLKRARFQDFEVINIEGPPYHGNLGAAIVDQQVRFLDDGLAVQPVYSLDELEGLGRFLEMPDSNARSWAEGIRDQVLGRQL